MAHTIVHFEIPSDNIERANMFYNDLFGWKMEKVPGPMEYWMFATGANNKGEQTIGEGGMERKIPSSHEQITIYIAVNSVNEYVKRVEELGGKVIKPKTEVRSYGWFALCMDTENITFSLCGRLIRNKRTPSSLLIFWCIFITLPSTLFLA